GGRTTSKRRSTSSRSAGSIAEALPGLSETPMAGWPPSHAFLMKVAVEDSGPGLFPTSSPSPQKSFSPQERQQRIEQQRYPSWQRGPLLLNDGAAGAHGQHHRRHSSSLSAGLTPTIMPGLLTCREDNMSKLATYSEEDDSDSHDVGGADQRRRHASTDSDKNKQPSTGRTVAVSEFSNLAGLSGAAAAVGAFPFKRAAATDARSLELVSSYSTAGYAGWSKFCLATSDGEEEEDLDAFSSFGQAKEGASEDSRTYSITSEEDGNSDETAPSLRGEQEGFGVAFSARRNNDKDDESKGHDDDDIEFTAQETQAIFRVMDRLECGAATIAKYAAFSLEDWLQDVCGPIIKDLEGSESYRSSGLNARHRFGREESIPYIRRFISAKLCPASPALLCHSLPARVRRRAFVNTAAAMRGEIEDPFSDDVTGTPGDDDATAAGGGSLAHNCNNFSSVVGRRLIEHGKTHYNAAAVVSISMNADGNGGGAPAISGVLTSAMAVPVSGVSRAVPAVVAPPGMDVNLDGVRATHGDHRRRPAGRRASGQKDSPPSDYGRGNNYGDGGGGSGGDGSRGDAGSVFQSFQDDEDYYAGDSDSCSPRSGGMLLTARSPPPSSPAGHAASSGRPGTSRIRQRSPNEDRQQRSQKPQNDRPSATVAATLNTTTKAIHLEQPQKEFPDFRARRASSSGETVQQVRRGGSGSGSSGGRAPRKKSEARANCTVAATSAARSSPPAPRPAAEVARRTELAVLSPTSSPKPTPAAAQPKAATRRRATMAAAGRDCAAGVGNPAVMNGGPQTRQPVGLHRQGEDKGSNFMAMLARARESKPEYTPESDETATTRSGGGGEYHNDHSNSSNDEGFHQNKASMAPVKHANRKALREAKVGGRGGGKDSKMEGKGGGVKRVFFASSTGQPLADGDGRGSGGGSSSSGNVACSFSLSCRGGCDCDDGGATDARPAAPTVPAVAETAKGSQAATVPPPEATAQGREKGRLLYEQVTRLGGAARPKMSPVRLARPRRPRVVYESLW
ncbi:unnamed protein product, partial [Scytosiphon promiscuus]